MGAADRAGQFPAEKESQNARSMHHLILTSLRRPKEDLEQITGRQMLRSHSYLLSVLPTSHTRSDCGFPAARERQIRAYVEERRTSMSTADR